MDAALKAYDAVMQSLLASNDAWPGGPAWQQANAAWSALVDVAGGSNQAHDAWYRYRGYVKIYERAVMRSEIDRVSTRWDAGERAFVIDGRMKDGTTFVVRRDSISVGGLKACWPSLMALARGLIDVVADRMERHVEPHANAWAAVAEPMPVSAWTTEALLWAEGMVNACVLADETAETARAMARLAKIRAEIARRRA